MGPAGHLAFGFTAKQFTPDSPVIVLLVAAYLIDLLHFSLIVIGFDEAIASFWAHSLLMALFWSVLTMILTFLFTKKHSMSLILGLVVFSHWILDFLVWNNLPVGFNNTLKVGLGFYNMLGIDPSNIQFNTPLVVAALLETGLLVIGLFIFFRVRRKQRAVS